MEHNWVIWFTGLHGAGKTTIASNLVKLLKGKNIPVVLLDGDSVRKLVSDELEYTLKDRNRHMKNVANISKVISENGVLTIACVASPTEESRNYAKSKIGNMILAYVKCPLEICESRDVKGHYKKARSKEKGFENFLGVSLKYEEPKNPDIVMDTSRQSAEQSVNELYNFLKIKHII